MAELGPSHLSRNDKAIFWQLLPTPCHGAGPNPTAPGLSNPVWRRGAHAWLTGLCLLQVLDGTWEMPDHGSASVQPGTQAGADKGVPQRAQSEAAHGEAVCTLASCHPPVLHCPCPTVRVAGNFMAKTG